MNIEEVKPKAWLIVGSKIFQDLVMLTETGADNRIAERNDGVSHKVPLYDISAQTAELTLLRAALEVCQRTEGDFRAEVAQLKGAVTQAQMRDHDYMQCVAAIRESRKQAEAATCRAEMLEKAINAQPHHHLCETQYEANGDCDCWKSKALAAEKGEVSA